MVPPLFAPLDPSPGLAKSFYVVLRVCKYLINFFILNNIYIYMYPLEKKEGFKEDLAKVTRIVKEKEKEMYRLETKF